MYRMLCIPNCKYWWSDLVKYGKPKETNALAFLSQFKVYRSTWVHKYLVTTAAGCYNTVSGAIHSTLTNWYKTGLSIYICCYHQLSLECHHHLQKSKDHIHHPRICRYVCMHAWLVCIHICMHMCMYICIDVHMYVCMHVSSYQLMDVAITQTVILVCTFQMNDI